MLLRVGNGLRANSPHLEPFAALAHRPEADAAQPIHRKQLVVLAQPERTHHRMMSHGEIVPREREMRGVADAERRVLDAAHSARDGLPALFREVRLLRELGRALDVLSQARGRASR